MAGLLRSLADLRPRELFCSSTCAQLPTTWRQQPSTCALVCCFCGPGTPVPVQQQMQLVSRTDAGRPACSCCPPPTYTTGMLDRPQRLSVLTFSKWSLCSMPALPPADADQDGAAAPAVVLVVAAWRAAPALQSQAAASVQHTLAEVLAALLAPAPSQQPSGPDLLQILQQMAPPLMCSGTGGAPSAALCQRLQSWAHLAAAVASMAAGGGRRLRPAGLAYFSQLVQWLLLLPTQLLPAGGGEARAVTPDDDVLQQASDSWAHLACNLLR